MTIGMIKNILLWCSIINMGLLILSFLFFRLAHDWIYKYHGEWYNLSEEKFNAIYYAMMVFFNTCILFFNIVPYVALCIVG